MSRRQPPRRPRSTTSSRRSTAPRRGPTPAQRASKLVDELHGELLSGDPLAAQLAAAWSVAELYERYWDVLAKAAASGAREPARPAARVAGLLAELRDQELRDAGLALALALGSLEPGDPTVEHAVDEAARKLRFLGATPPAWAGATVELDGDSTWQLTDVFGDAVTIYIPVRFVGVEGPAHTVAAHLEQADTVELVDVTVGGPASGLAAEIAASLESEADVDPELWRFEPISPARAGELVWDALHGMEESAGEHLDESAFEALALLEARALLLEPAMVAAREAGELADPSRAEQLDELSLPQLLDRFTSSDAFTSTDGADRDVALRIVDWATRIPSGGAVRTGPLVVSMLLEDLARDAAGDAPATELLLASAAPTIRAWVAWCAELCELPDAARTELSSGLDRLLPDFEAELRDPTPAGLAEQLVALMERDGVDLDSEPAVEAWMRFWSELDEGAQAELLGRLADGEDGPGADDG